MGLIDFDPWEFATKESEAFQAEMCEKIGKDLGFILPCSRLFQTTKQDRDWYVKSTYHKHRVCYGGDPWKVQELLLIHLCKARLEVQLCEEALRTIYAARGIDPDNPPPVQPKGDNDANVE